MRLDKLDRDGNSESSSGRDGTGQARADELEQVAGRTDRGGGSWSLAVCGLCGPAVRRCAQLVI